MGYQKAIEALESNLFKVKDSKVKKQTILNMFTPKTCPLCQVKGCSKCPAYNKKSDRSPCQKVFNARSGYLFEKVSRKEFTKIFEEGLEEVKAKFRKTSK